MFLIYSLIGKFMEKYNKVICFIICMYIFILFCFNVKIVMFLFKKELLVSMW